MIDEIEDFHENVCENREGKNREATKIFTKIKP